MNQLNLIEQEDCIAQLQGNVTIQEIFPNENVFGYLERVFGQIIHNEYLKIIGAANEFKEGDCLVGVAAADQESRERARQLLLNTTIEDIHNHPLYKDQLQARIWQDTSDECFQGIKVWTLQQLKDFILKQENDLEIQKLIMPGLDSDVIGCLVKLMNNCELIKLGSTIFNPIKGTNIGAKGYMGARIQPNSPTNDPLDIIWQVFNGFSYAVGDVMLGTNPASSTQESIEKVELGLKSVVEAFNLKEILPWCVLVHIDVQQQVEDKNPGSTSLFFQSLGSNEDANKTFGISTDKMMDYAASRTGAFGLYFETGQGADFTNGHSHGFDMVVHESRKYGFARSLIKKISEVKGKEQPVWVVTNDVAGFIGPEVFRSKEQLVRVCLEDIAMGKLHGLTIGLDICSTLHMNISFEDLEWCQDQIMPANPGYLMGLPTRNDPMLCIMTTGFQDHWRIREKFGYKVNDAMWEFYKRIQVIDDKGNPTEHFGDPVWIYYLFCQYRGDKRSKEEIYNEGIQQLQIVRDHGVYIAEGHGEKIWQLNNNLKRELANIYALSKKAIWAEWDMEFIRQNIPNYYILETQIINRNDYLLHPEHGEQFNNSSIQKIQDLKRKRDINRIYPDVQIVISEGLNALSIMKEDHLTTFLPELKKLLEKNRYSVAEEIIVIFGGRVRAGYRLGEYLFGSEFVGSRKEKLIEKKILIHIIGERPGNGKDTFSVYMVSPEQDVWSQKGTVDHNICKLVSGISNCALHPKIAAQESIKILNLMIQSSQINKKNINIRYEENEQVNKKQSFQNQVTFNQSNTEQIVKKVKL